MGLQDKLSIVIPCKNEGKNIKMVLDCLNYQNNIDDVNVIIDNNFKFIILLTNKVLITRKNMAKRKSNIDLIKIILPSVDIFFNVLIIEKKNNKKIK